MYSRVLTSVNIGIEGHMITIETQLQQGLPQYNIVGLASKVILEAKERVRSALVHCDSMLPLMRITQNLSPSQLKKEGVQMDLAIAIGILAAQDEDIRGKVKDIGILGALTLDGRIERVPGILSLIEGLVRNGVCKIIIPNSNILPFSLFPGVTFYGYEHMNDVVLALKNDMLMAMEPQELILHNDYKTSDLDLSDIRGQTIALRALEIALIGKHNILFVGPPGCGKTMILKRLKQLLTLPSVQERFEISKIYSLTDPEKDVASIDSRPVVMPHHTISRAALIGGGNKCLPGEISKAHLGVLALDELGEFNKDVIEVLREPLSTGDIRISKGQLAVTYPARFQLIATMNPCFCGYYGSKAQNCTCSSDIRKKYKQKFSGPILDRIDMIVYMDRVFPEDMDETLSEMTSIEVQSRLERYKFVNRDEIELSKEAENTLRSLYHKGKISLRRWDHLKSLSVSIAIKNDSKTVHEKHIYEALLFDGTHFRNQDEVV